MISTKVDKTTNSILQQILDICNRVWMQGLILATTQGVYTPYQIANGKGKGSYFPFNATNDKENDWLEQEVEIEVDNFKCSFKRKSCFDVAAKYEKGLGIKLQKFNTNNQLTNKSNMKQTLDLMRGSIYVGTYHKYNEGNLGGKWLNVADYDSKEQFLEACKQLHKDEHDPEFMYQDHEYIPEEMCDESWVSSEIWSVLGWCKQHPNDVGSFSEFCEERGFPTDADSLEEYKQYCIDNGKDKAKDKSKNESNGNGKDEPIKGLHLESMPNGVTVIADEAKYTFMHRKEMKECGAVWNKDAKQWQATTPESVQKLTAWIKGEITVNVEKGDKSEKVEKFECDLEKFLKTEIPYWQESYRKILAAAVEVLPHVFFLIEKGKIEKSFCFGYDTFGNSYEEAERACNAVDEKYVKEQNMKPWNDMEETLKQGKFYIYVGDKYEVGKLITCNHLSTENQYHWHPNEYVTIDKEHTPDKFADVEKAVKYAKAAFEKRIDSYLKKYGTSKIKAWTYDRND